MNTRRELLKQSGKLLWAAPVMTTILRGADCCNRAELKMYSAYFVQKTRPDEVYSDNCNAFCRAWYDLNGGFQEFRNEVGGWWAFPGENGW